MKPSEITMLLNKAEHNQQDWDQILPIVYQQLKVLAHHAKSKHKENNVLNTTSLVHEVFLKIQKNSKLNVKGSKHFYHLASQAMRQIITDAARKQLSSKRNAIEQSIDDEIELNLPSKDFNSYVEIIEVDKALNQLKQLNERLATIVVYHFYAGYSFVEIAGLLDLSESTVIRDWKKARAWLFANLS